ncbi:MAG: GTP pyrophosphokinase family protein [Kosmotoga sp.]|nr:MAG: GTP pyrophosphokinase family protein [Kosmotoga sp.]
MQVEHSRARDFFERREFLDEYELDNVHEDITKAINSFIKIENIYASAARNITTRLENLNDEIQIEKNRNLVHEIKTRIKKPRSIAEKLLRKGYELSIESARDNLNDIAGIRVICSFVDDVYTIAGLLLSQDDFYMIQKTDYIRNPKPNGYRSLHIDVEIPVFLSKQKEWVKAEIQFRTIAMDYWATLEHDLGYKFNGKKTEEITKELKECSDLIAQADLRMEKLHKVLYEENE